VGESRPDPRVRRTRQLLQTALTELLAEKSFEAITVREIAERATINRVTFYAHFQDKLALLEYHIRQRFADRLGLQAAGEAGLSPERIDRLIQTVSLFLSEMHRCPAPHRQFDPLMEKEIKALVYDVVRSWIVETGARSPAADRDQDLKAMVAAWAIYGGAAQWIRQQERTQAEEFARRLSPMITAILEAPVGPRPSRAAARSSRRRRPERRATRLGAERRH
jgi:AcrR family transcriptional regulator